MIITSSMFSFSIIHFTRHKQRLEQTVDVVFTLTLKVFGVARLKAMETDGGLY